MITIDVIASLDGFNAVRDRWDSLLEHTGRASIFQTWAWLDLWLRHYGHDCRLFIVTGTDEQGGLAGIAPLMIRPSRLFGISVRSVEFIGSGGETTPDHLRFIVKHGAREGFARRVFQCLRRHRGAWDLVRLRDMDEDDDFTALVNGAGAYRHDVAGSLRDRCPYITLPRTWNEYLAGLSGKTRYHFKTYERALREKHGAVFSVVESPEALAPALRALECLHRRRMEDKQLTGASLDERFWRFHAEAIRMLLPQGRILLSMLTVGETVIACTYSFVYRGVVSFYQTGLDPAWKKHAAGTVLLARTIREALERGMVEFDLMRGDESYKFHLTQQFRENRTLYVWNDTGRGAVLRALYRVTAWLRRRVRRERTAQVSNDTR